MEGISDAIDLGHRGIGSPAEPERKDDRVRPQRHPHRTRRLKPYLALDGKYAVGKRFNACQLK